MKKYLVLFMILFLAKFLAFSQNVERLSTAEKFYSRDDLGLATTALFPEECLFYWCGIFTSQNSPCYIDSVELSFAFERIDISTVGNDTLIVDIYQGDVNTSKGLLKRYYSYKYDLGALGFPEKYSSDPYSWNFDSRPTFMMVRFDAPKVKISNKSFIIGFRIKTKGKSSWLPGNPSCWVKWYGLNISKIDLNSTNQHIKPLSRRYKINVADQNASSLDYSFVTITGAIYMNAYVSGKAPSDPSKVVDVATTPKYECDAITSIQDNFNEKNLEDYNLLQNYPNPFNPSTNIVYDLPRNSKVKIEVINILGQKIRILLDTKQDRGHYVIPFDANNLPGGVYFYNITAIDNEKNVFSQTRKMIYIK